MNRREYIRVFSFWFLVCTDRLTRNQKQETRNGFSLVIPSAAATTATSITSATTASAATSTTTASGSTATTAASTARSSAAAFAHGTGFVYNQRTAQEILAIARLNRPVGFFVVAEFRESETARIACEFIANDLHGIGLKSGSSEPVL